MPQKIVPTNQKGIKDFFNKNESNQNVVTIHSLDKSFSLLNFQDGPTLTQSAALTD